MISTGTQLRELLEKSKLSQARLAELTNIPQYILSAFELEKAVLRDEHLDKVVNVISNLSKHEDIVGRKKRYRTHSYDEAIYDNNREALSYKSTGNENYLRELRNISSNEEKRFTGISLFSGCGGFSIGFRGAGCDIKGFVEIDNGLSNIYSKNFPETKRIGNDIKEIQSKNVEKFCKQAGDVDVVIGGPPCQGFSLSGKRNINDPRNYFFQEYMRIIDIVRPKVAIIENVRLLTSMKSKNGGFVKDQITSDLRSHGYNAKLFQINACHYGVPQHRERVFFIAVRSDLGIAPSFPESHFGKGACLFHAEKKLRTFADACSDLKYLESGQKSEDPLHSAVRHPDHVIRWLWDVPQGASAHDNEDPALRPPSGYNTTYKRQAWEEPGATVQTTFGMISGCRNVHPIATRSLTIREAARLQSFPDNYKFVGSLGTIRTGIGNAVPPLLARAIADHIRTAILDLVKVPRS